jgi:hypothetical protein
MQVHHDQPTAGRSVEAAWPCSRARSCQWARLTAAGSDIQAVLVPCADPASTARPVAVAVGPSDQFGVGGVGGAKGRSGQPAAEPIQQDRDVAVLVAVDSKNELQWVGH